MIDRVEKYVYTHGKVSANKTLMLTRLHGSLFGQLRKCTTSLRRSEPILHESDVVAR